MRFACVIFLVLLGAASTADGQSLTAQATAGPTLTDAGHSVAAGVGYSPISKLILVFTVERTHLASRTTGSGGHVSSFRGGTMVLGTGEVRFVPFGRDRFRPYGLAGVATGVSRPTVNATFPNPVSNRVNAVFVGGGVQVPVSARLAVLADVRMMFGAEGVEGIVAVAPLRAGISYRF